MEKQKAQWKEREGHAGGLLRPQVLDSLHRQVLTQVLEELSRLSGESSVATEISGRGGILKRRTTVQLLAWNSVLLTKGFWIDFGPSHMQGVNQRVRAPTGVWPCLSDNLSVDGATKL